MWRVKGCVDEKCIARQKKIFYKESDEFCSKCGKKLTFVCKKCYTVLEDSKEKYCIRHLEERTERKEKAMKIGGTVISTVAVVGGAAFTAVKKLIHKP